MAFANASPELRHLRFHVTAACFEHRHYIGHSPVRMDAFARDLLALFTTHAWNGEENSRRRKVFFRAVEQAMRSRRSLDGPAMEQRPRNISCIQTRKKRSESGMSIHWPTTAKAGMTDDLEM